MPVPPTPSALRLLRGDKDHGRGLPKPDDFDPPGEAVKPPWIKGKAAKYWEKLAPDLIGAGVLRACDSDQFAMLCTLYAEFETTKGKMAAGRIAQLRAIASEFGIGAASRTRIKLEPAKPKSAASKYFDGTNG